MCFKMPKVEQTARDILPSSEGKTPESPVFGDADIFGIKRKGKESLKIARTDTINQGYSATNYNL